MGDTVIVRFPEKNFKKMPKGILLTDEFIDEKEESCAIFCPIENGNKLIEAAIKLPVKFFERITTI